MQLDVDRFIAWFGDAGWPHFNEVSRFLGTTGFEIPFYQLFLFGMFEPYPYQNSHLYFLGVK